MHTCTCSDNLYAMSLSYLFNAGEEFFRDTATFYGEGLTFQSTEINGFIAYTFNGDHFMQDKDPGNGFLGCSNLPVLMDAFKMFEPEEDPIDKKRRKKKEKAARQKAAKEAKATVEQAALKGASKDGPWPFYEVYEECMVAFELTRSHEFSTAVGKFKQNCSPAASFLFEMVVVGMARRFDNVTAAIKMVEDSDSPSSSECWQVRNKLMILLTVLREAGGASKDSAYGAFIRFLMVGNAEKECFACGKPAKESGSRCHGCHVACFCNKACQQKGWQVHAADCKVCQKTIADKDAVNSLKSLGWDMTFRCDRYAV